MVKIQSKIKRLAKIQSKLEQQKSSHFSRNPCDQEFHVKAKKVPQSDSACLRLPEFTLANRELLGLKMSYM